MAIQQILTDAEVRVMRQMRLDGASYPELAERFEVHTKTVELICRGFDRIDAGGVIEHAPGKFQGDHPFDPRRLVRFPGCGALVHPPCFKCAMEERDVGSPELKMQAPK